MMDTQITFMNKALSHDTDFAAWSNRLDQMVIAAMEAEDNFTPEPVTHHMPPVNISMWSNWGKTVLLR